MRHLGEPRTVATLIARGDARHSKHAGRGLAAVRNLGLLVCVVTFAAFIASVPAAYHIYTTVCTARAQGLCLDGQATAQSATALLAYGISLPAYAFAYTALVSLITTAYAVLAAIIFWRRSNDPMALFAAVFLVTFGVGSSSGFLHALQQQDPNWSPLVECLTYIGDMCIGIFFYLFPSGRFVPRWTRWTAIALAAYNAPVFFPQVPLPHLLGGLLFYAFIVTFAAAQIYRYRRVSTSRQREQTKWVVFGLVLTVVVQIIFTLPYIFSLATQGSVYDVATNGIFALGVLPIPLSIAIAILRSHLFDIDVIINRTLVYASLTAVLAAVYFGCVIGLQHLAVVLAGTEAGANPVIIVLSTLLIAALFQPLRARIQKTIDRRFYRRKYDATRTLAAFGQKLRTEVDLEGLQAHLLATVEETMQPAQAWLWLRTPSQGRAQ